MDNLSVLRAWEPLKDQLRYERNILRKSVETLDKPVLISLYEFAFLLSWWLQDRLFTAATSYFQTDKPSVVFMWEIPGHEVFLVEVNPDGSWSQVESNLQTEEKGVDDGTSDFDGCGESV